MNLQPLKTLLTAILGRFLTIVGTWIASKGFADADSANGIATYAAPLAGVVFIGADIAWEYLRTTGLHEVIAFLKAKLSSAKDAVPPAAKVLVGALLLGGMTFGATGCQTIQHLVGTVAEESSYLQAAATAATGVYLLTVSDVAARTQAANRIWSAANGADSLTTGTLPTPDALKQAILAWGGSDADASYGEFAATVIDSYQSIYQNVIASGGATALDATSLVEAIAAGARAGAAQYATVAGGF